jgi:polysaccharide deacetylase 2 family uncharacterized protein YibQ
MLSKLINSITYILNYILQKLKTRLMAIGLIANIVNIIMLLIESSRLRLTVINFIVVIGTTISSTYMYFIYSNDITEKALQNNKLILVNAITDEIFAGSLYKEPESAHSENKTDDINKEFAQVNEKITQPAPPKSDEDLEAKASIYKKPLLPSNFLNKNKIIILVKNLGLNQSITEEVLNSNITLTLGFSPYAADISKTIEKATDKNFETLINLPLQPIDYQTNDQGPYALLNNLSAADNINRLYSILSKSNKILGVYIEENENFSSSRTNIYPIIEILKKKDLILVNTNKINDLNIDNLCKSLGVQYFKINANLDDNLDINKINETLKNIENISISQGYAVLVTSALPITLNAIKTWYKNLDQNQFILASISHLSQIIIEQNIANKIASSSNTQANSSEPPQVIQKNDKNTEESINVTELDKTKQAIDDSTTPPSDGLINTNTTETKNQSNNDNAITDNKSINKPAPQAQQSVDKTKSKNQTNIKRSKLHLKNKVPNKNKYQNAVNTKDKTQ